MTMISEIFDFARSLHPVWGFCLITFTALTIAWLLQGVVFTLFRVIAVLVRGYPPSWCDSLGQQFERDDDDVETLRFPLQRGEDLMKWLDICIRTQDLAAGIQEGKAANQIKWHVWVRTDHGDKRFRTHLTKNPTNLYDAVRLAVTTSQSMVSAGMVEIIGDNRVRFVVDEGSLYAMNVIRYEPGVLK